MNPSVISIASPAASLELVGGKALSLARLALNKMPIPPGFVLTTAAYKNFILANNLNDAIATLVDKVTDDGAHAIATASTGIHALFTASAIKPEMCEAITQAYIELGEPAVAVRSSATAEDLPDLSFAGQQDTFLNVRGETALLAAVRNCWASLWTARAIGYRQQMNIDQRVVAMAVVVQAMVEPEVSGILFTANPATGDRSEIVINASYGLGESIVGGQISPDTYVLDRDSLTLKETIVGTKEVKIVSKGDQGVTTLAVDAGIRSESSMPTAALRKLATLSLDVEQLFDGAPQDIEWAQADGNIYLLQSRPITRLPVAPLTDVQWQPPDGGGKLIRRQVVENIPDPLSPLFSELYLQIGLEESIDRLMAHWQAPFDISEFMQRPLFVTVNGYAYCQADYRIPWRRIPKILFWYIKFLPKLFRDIIPQWRDDGLPAYLATITQWKAVDAHAATDEQLLIGVRELTIADADYWFRIAMVIGIAKMTDGALHLFLAGLVKGQLISGMFLRGFPSKTREAQADLEAIANRIIAVASLKKIVNATPAKNLIESLNREADGERITAGIQAYLEVYGHQIYTLDFVQETQIEDPLPVLLSLKRMVQQENSGAGNQFAELIEERDLLERQTLESIGPIRRWIFRKLLRWAQNYGPYREDALFYMGAAWPTVRKFALELGRRLVEIGTFTSPDEVFYLSTEELVEAYSA